MNNIAWLLRRLPLFLLPDGGRCRLQPVSVFDLARIAADLGESDGNVVLDLAGPESFTFADFVAQIKDAVGSHARLVAAPSGFASTCAALAGFLLRDRLLTRDELGALTANLLACETATTESRFGDWLEANASWLGRDYANELRRNWDPSLSNSEAHCATTEKQPAPTRPVEVAAGTRNHSATGCACSASSQQAEDTGSH